MITIDKMLSLAFRYLKRYFLTYPEFFYLFLINFISGFYINIAFQIKGFSYVTVAAVYLFTVIFFSFMRNKKFNITLRISVLLICLIAFFLIIYLNPELYSRIKSAFTIKSVSSLLTGMSGYVSTDYEVIKIYFIPALIIFNFFQLLLMYFKKHLFAVLSCALVIYGISVTGYDRSNDFFSMLFAFVLLFYSGIFVLKQKKPDAINLSYVKFIFSMSAVSTAVVIFISLGFVKFDTGKALTVKIWNYFLPENVNDFNFKMTGFSKSGELGGKISSDNTVVLKVVSDSPVYLKGTVYDFYDGKRWQQTDHPEFQDVTESDNI
ncbi:MAG: hypothetical protein JW982_09980, partial [Spirochaetes bacterium]|nr:hypothetical protein [Spirochaetota bacterium]